LLNASLSPCCRYHPAEVENRVNQLAVLHTAFALSVAGSASEASHFRGHLCVRLRCGPVTRGHPYDDPVDGLQVIGFPPPCHPSYKASGFCLGGIHFPLNASAFAGRTAEHAVDLDTGAIVAVTVQGADQGDTTTIIETAIAAAEQSEAAQAEVQAPQALEEIVTDKGYHSNQTMIDFAAVDLRSYVAEPDRGRRDWSKEPAAQSPVYANRRRIRGARGRRLMRQRGERIERSFAHLYDTGGMRRTHLRGHANILKRLLIHAGGFNLGLLMRHLIGSGTPRGLQDRLGTVIAMLLSLIGATCRCFLTISPWQPIMAAARPVTSPTTTIGDFSAVTTYTTGC
jgi:hypothetical protein